MTKTRQEKEFLEGYPEWAKLLVKCYLLLFVASILAGLANPVLYQSFLAEQGVGFWDTPGWGRFWEFHTGPIGLTLTILEFAPYALGLMAFGCFSIYARLAD